MDRAASIRIVARWLLVAAGLTCAIGMVGPFQGVERAWVPWDKAAHFIAFYGLTILLFAAFPTRRRLDLVVMAVFAGSAIEAAQFLDGRDAELGDILADAAGALAVFAPVWLDWARQSRPDRRAARSAVAPTATEPA